MLGRLRQNTAARPRRRRAGDGKGPYHYDSSSQRVTPLALSRESIAAEDEAEVIICFKV